MFFLKSAKRDDWLIFATSDIGILLYWRLREETDQHFLVSFFRYFTKQAPDLDTLILFNNHLLQTTTGFRFLRHKQHHLTTKTNQDRRLTPSVASRPASLKVKEAGSIFGGSFALS